MSGPPPAGGAAPAPEACGNPAPPESPEIRVVGFDHFVLRVADVERSLAWWCGRLGLAGVRVDEWRRGEVPFPSVRIDPHTIVDLMRRRPTDAPTDTRVLDHVCLVLAPGTDLAALAAAGDLDVHQGPVAGRFGARGNADSLYVRDPDGIVVELRVYD